MATTETGHHPNRCYTDQDGNFHLNGSSFYTDESGTVLSTTETGYIDGVTAGTQAASKAVVLDANMEIDGLGTIKVSDTLISSAQVLAMNATPQTLVAAPAAGVALEFVGAYLFIDYGTTAYTDDAGEDFCIRYTDGSGTIVSETVDGTDLDVAADALLTVRPVALQHAGLTANAALVAHILTGELADGDSPFKVRTYYREVRVASLEAIA